jgi:hypothetical protein
MSNFKGFDANMKCRGFQFAVGCALLLDIIGNAFDGPLKRRGEL